MIVNAHRNLITMVVAMFFLTSPQLPLFPPVVSPGGFGRTKHRCEVTVNASELQGLEEEVKLLKSSMVSMAKARKKESTEI
jgi:hypothetical protein